MSPKSFDPSGLQFAWDATSISLAETCLRKYQLRMIEGWQPARKSVHLIFGGHYATALEHFYKYRADGASIEDALRRVVREAMIDSWDHEYGESPERDEGTPGMARARGSLVRLPGTGKPAVFDHPAKTRPNLIRSIIWYVDQFADESSDGIQTYHLANGKPAVELSFTLNVTEDIVFCGHLDRVVSYAGDLYVMDQKTTGSTISPRFFEGFKPDVQMSMYTFAGKAVLQTPVKGVIIDGAQIAGGFTRFERGFTFRTAAELEEWFNASLDTIHRAREATATGYFPMNRTACGNYGGCEYRHICSRSPEVRPQFLKAEFTQGPRWDPLERR